MITALTNARIMTNGGLVDGRTVVIEGGRIRAVTNSADIPAGARRKDLENRILLPGFVDVQVNGGGGVLFGDAPSIETLETISRAHARYGTTAFLPTILSSDLRSIRAAMKAVDGAIEAGVPGVSGIHIEGPFLSAARKGIHDASLFRSLDSEAFEILTSLKHGRTLVTLAPEETTPSTIRALSKAGVIVSAGHTDATYSEIRAGLESGLSGFTHLFNAMSPLASRAPGAVGAALEDEKSWCGIIVDGKHVDPVVLRIALRMKPANRIMLVTDAMPSVGSAKKTFELRGRTIRAVNGACIAADGTLAGTDLDMARAIRNACEFLGVSLPQAVQMASHNPAAFLGLADEMGTIAPGYRANLVLVTEQMEVLGSWIDGCEIGREAD